ncbi:MAG: ribose-phosphate pyrophosphokinase [Firmicutes bacterium]|nr:ribose-phosphate pyrophosphokinase [Bacillota bacterium]
MSANSISDQIAKHSQVAPIGIIAMNGTEELNRRMNYHLERLLADVEDPMMDKTPVNVKLDCPRFQSGDGKGVLDRSVRGLDLYIICDVGAYNCTYRLFDQVVPMSPDEHFADLKRCIQAIAGKAHRINVIMPILYGGRQHRKKTRESLDGAVALQELQAMGVTELITFDAHDPRLVNAVPLMGFDNVIPSYQCLKALLRHVPDIKIDKDNFMVVSPDEGGMDRNVFYASVLGVELGMYYKRRDFSQVVNGRNPIVAHEFLGSDIKGKDVFIYDDMISSGESVLDIAYDMKSRGSGRVFAGCTYALFTDGIDKFNKAYEHGVLTGVLSTNLTYRRPELLAAPWYYEVDCSKYLAYIIAAMNHDMSVGLLLDPVQKINTLIGEHRAKFSNQQIDLFNK